VFHPIAVPRNLKVLCRNTKKLHRQIKTCLESLVLGQERRGQIGKYFKIDQKLFGYQGPVSRKPQKLFKPEKPFVKNRIGIIHSTKL